jgi:hypothetical protein
MSVSYSTFICATYLVIGLGLIFLNQHILKMLNFPFPMFLSGLGVITSALFSHVIVWLGYVKLSKREAVEGILWYQRVLPVGFAHAATLAFGNMVYLLLDVGFIQMLKSFTPVIIISFGYVSNIDIPSYATIYSVTLISVGIAATCSFRPVLHLLGIGVMLLSEITEAVRLILTQFLLKQMKFGVVEGQYVLAPASAFWLMLASLVFESQKMYELNAVAIFIESFPYFMLASCLGVIVNFMAYSVIQATSSLTMKMLGTLRNLVTIFLGVMLYQEVVTVQEAQGYLVALIGFIGFNLSSSGFFDQYELLQVPPHIALIQIWNRVCCICAAEASAVSSKAKYDDEEEGLINPPRK